MIIVCCGNTKPLAEWLMDIKTLILIDVILSCLNEILTNELDITKLVALMFCLDARCNCYAISEKIRSISHELIQIIIIIISSIAVIICASPQVLHKIHCTN